MTTRLIRRIPDLELHELPYAGQCCGAAGTQMLTQPDIAETLAELIVEQVERLDCRILLTSNVGCALHLRRMLERAKRTGRVKSDLEVMHPVTLAWRQLESRPN